MNDEWKMILNKAFDLMAELVISYGGDGDGVIIVAPDRYEETRSALLSWVRNSIIRDWRIFNESPSSIIFIYEQESLTLTCDDHKRAFGEYILRI